MKNKSSIYPIWPIWPVAIIYGIFFVLPVVSAFVFSFTDWNIERLFTPEFNGLNNFTFLFKDEIFSIAMKNTLLFAIVTSVLKIVFGLAIALAVVQPLRSKNILRTIFYLPAVLSSVVIGLIFTSIYDMNGLLNSVISFFANHKVEIIWLGDEKTAIWAVIATEVWRWSGFCMAIFIAGLQGIPQDYYEAATIDGASSFTQFKNITLPLLAPAFTVNITMNLIGGLRVFDQVYVLTNGGPGFSTQVLSTYIFSSFSQGLLGRSAALGMLLFVFVGIVSVTVNSVLRKREVEI